MKYTAPLFILFPLVLLSQTALLAETITHSHNGRTHTHPLPTTGLNHSHIPSSVVRYQTPVKQKKEQAYPATTKKIPKRVRPDDLKKQAKPTPVEHRETQSEKPSEKPKVVVRHTPPPTNSSAGSPTDCEVEVTITSDTNFTSMTTDRGGGADSYDAYPVYIEQMYILDARTRRPYITLDFNPSIRKRKNFTDHRTGEKYSVISNTFQNILDGYTYIATLGGGWITEPRSITFRCPNAKGQRKFSLGRIKHIGIMGDG